MSKHPTWCGAGLPPATEFTPISEDPDPRDWDLPSLAVVASDGDHGQVLWHVGAHVAEAIDSGGGSSTEEAGLDEPDPGIWIWEGRTQIHRSYEGDQDVYLEGAYRQPTAAEWAAICLGKCPWDPADWMVRP